MNAPKIRVLNLLGIGSLLEWAACLFLPFASIAFAFVGAESSIQTHTGRSTTICWWYSDVNKNRREDNSDVHFQKLLTTCYGDVDHKGCDWLVSRYVACPVSPFGSSKYTPLRQTLSLPILDQHLQLNRSLFRVDYFQFHFLSLPVAIVQYNRGNWRMKL